MWWVFRKGHYGPSLGVGIFRLFLCFLVFCFRTFHTDVPRGGLLVYAAVSKSLNCRPVWVFGATRVRRNQTLEAALCN